MLGHQVGGPGGRVRNIPSPRGHLGSTWSGRRPPHCMERGRERGGGEGGREGEVGDWGKLKPICCFNKSALSLSLAKWPCVVMYSM